MLRFAGDGKEHSFPKLLPIWHLSSSSHRPSKRRGVSRIEAAIQALVERVEARDGKVSQLATLWT